MNKWIGYWVLVLIFGSGFLFLNVASSGFSALELTAIRLIVATTILNIVLLLSGGRLPWHWPQIRALGLLGIINYSIPFTLLAWAQQQGVDSGLTGVLTALNPLFTLILAHYFFSDERLTLLKLGGVLGGLIGTVILASRNFGQDAIIIDTLAGQIAVVGATFCFAITNIMVRRLVLDPQMTPLVVAAGSAVGGTGVSILILAAAWFSGTSVTDISGLTDDQLLATAVLSLIHSATSFVLVKYVIRELGASVTSTTTYIVPILALGLGTVFLDEVIDERVLLGTVVILGSVALVNIGKRAFVRRQVEQPAQ